MRLSDIRRGLTRALHCKIIYIEMKRFIRNLAIIFVLVEVADAIVTLAGLSIGHEEGNPIIAPIAHTWALPMVKTGGALAIAIILCYLAGRNKDNERPIAGGFLVMIVIQMIALALWGLVFSA